MLLVEEAHRRKGLGKGMLQLHVLHWLDAGWECNPYCYIANENEASQALFTGMGFVRKGAVQWEGFRLKVKEEEEEEEEATTTTTTTTT